MHAGRRKSSQSKETNFEDTIMRSEKIFQAEDKDEAISIASQGNVGAAQIVPPTCSHKPIKKGYKG
jgi:hypothetical protein